MATKWVRSGLMPAPVIVPTPGALVESGRIHTGFFRTPFRRVNLIDADLPGGPRARLWRRLRLKEWVGFGFDHPECYGAMIIQNAAYAASGTVYLFDKPGRRFTERLVVDLPFHARLPEHLWRGESRCGRGRRSLRFSHELDLGRHTVRVDIRGRLSGPPLIADLVLHQDPVTVEPLVVSLPIPPDHHTYTHKSPLRLEGTIRLGDRRYDFDPDRDLGNLDEQKSFYPYRSTWMWGCLAARSVEGRTVAVNFVNQMTPRDQPGEDALWIDGRLTLLPRPSITRLPDGRYRIGDPEGRLRLHFTPDGAKSERRNWGPVAIDYRQLFGRYDGTLVDSAGTSHSVTGAFGPLEFMNARF